MEELLLRVIQEGEWKPLRFTVYNYLDEHELYQPNLEKMGYDGRYEDLEGKTIVADNIVGKQFKHFIEKKLQGDNVVVSVCVLEDRDYFVIVKPKSVDILSALKMD